MNGPCMSVDAFLAAAGIGNGTAKRQRGQMVAELLKTVQPDLRARLTVQTMQAAASWVWPLAVLHTALLTVQEKERDAAEKQEQTAELWDMLKDQPSPVDLLQGELMEMQASLSGELPAADLMPYVERCLAHLETLTPNK